ncbi:AAA family ATPase [Pleomorphovibrio marinus]|uniref:AAA family ATPase n=1 Tax=Pleomorphovibrio marinus TaxID=2164132 RepID=UPI000E0A3AAF|nr:AAA family ATPase [Pleomorphovibrio marinus]
MKQTIYFISGPAGVGKSTTAKQLINRLAKGAYISGDDVSHIPIKGRRNPWLCEETYRLTWENIFSLTQNLLKYGYNVVIDYVSFPRDVDWFVGKLNDQEAEVKYVVLSTDLSTLLHRDGSRPEELKMGERCSILFKEFRELEGGDRFTLNTEAYGLEKMEEIVDKLMEDRKYIWY